MDFPNGTYFKAYLASDNLTTATEIVLTDMDGTAMPLAQNERPIFDTIIVNNGALGGVITIFQDLDGDAAVDSGEEVLRVSCAANQSAPFESQRAGRKATSATAANRLVKAVASSISAGTTILLTGRILKV